MGAWPGPSDETFSIDIDAIRAGGRDSRLGPGRPAAPQLRGSRRQSPAVVHDRRHRSAYGRLIPRLSKGRANTGRGTALFLRETISRTRYAGAKGPFIVRAYSSFYTHSIIAACRDKSVRLPITIRQHQSGQNIIEVASEVELMPIPYWMDGFADLAETA